MAGSNSPKEQLKYIYSLIRQDNRREAQQLLKQFLRDNPQSADGYYLATFLTDDPERKIQACERALKINPQHGPTRKLLETLRPEPIQPEMPEESDPFADLISAFPPSAIEADPFNDPFPALPYEGDPFADLPQQPVQRAQPAPREQKITPIAPNAISRNNLAVGLGAALIVTVFLLLAMGLVILPRLLSPAPTSVVRVVTSTPPRATRTDLPSPTASPTNTPQPGRGGTRLPTFTPVKRNPINSSQFPTPVAAKATSVAFSGPVVGGSISPIQYAVIDAEYSSSLDRIIAVSDNPPTLHMYDPEKGTDTAVGLSRAPTCISVGPDGKFAAVGHDALVTYIDLQKAAVVKTLDITTTAFDIVLDANGWVYVMPERDQWEALHIVQIESNNEITGGGNVYAGGYIKRHNDGTSIYYLERNLSPAHMYHYYTSPDGKISAEHDWPYHGTYYHCGNAWLSADSRRIFSACGNVFRSSTDPKQDMTYNGALAGVGQVYGLVHVASANKVIAIAASKTSPGNTIPRGQAFAPNIFTFDYDTLSQTGALALPPFADGKASAGRFIFANAAGTRYYVIVQDSNLTADQLNSGQAPQGGSEFGVIASNVGDNQSVDNTVTASPVGEVASAPSATPVISQDATPTLPPKPTVAVASSGILPFTYRVTQAEFSKSLNRIILVSEDPIALHIYNAVDNTETAVALPRVPTSLSVSPDGKFAAVGHDALVSYVDLQAAKVSKTFEVALPVANVTLGGNGWIYVSGSNGNQAIEIATGQQDTGFGGMGRVFPNGQSVYTLGGNSSYGYGGVAHYDISEGKPKPINANGRGRENANICGKIWLSEDGKRLFTGCSTILRPSSDPNQDLSYNGTLNRLVTVAALAQSQASGRVLAIGNSQNPAALTDNKVIVYDYETLGTDKILELPNFNAAGSSYMAHGRYVFFNPNGIDFYVIVQADDKSGLLNDFGLISMKLEGVTITPSPVGQSENASVVSTTAPTATPSIKSPIQMLDFSVTDAEYSKALDRIIMISTDPKNALIIYNPIDGQRQTVALSRAPTALGVAPDGLYAAVGHDALVTLVDLKAAKAMKTYDVSLRVADVAMALNGWIYALPYGSNNRTIAGIDVKTGQSSSTDGTFYLYDGTLRLYPDGKRMYYAQQGLSPSSLYRVDIGDDGKLSDGRKWPYHGDYEQCGKVWISEDGLRLMSACGTMFRASSDPKQDMTYNGRLDQGLYKLTYGLTYYGMAHSLPAKLIFALPAVDQSRQISSIDKDIPKQKILVFNYESLEFTRTVDLPQFANQSKLVDGNALYIFINSKGDQFHVVMQAAPGSGLLNDFGVWSGPVAAQ